MGINALMALLLTPVIDIPQLAIMAVICPKTNTYKCIPQELGMLPTQLDSLLTTVSSLLGVNWVVVENVICEALQARQKWDFLLPGQHFHFYFKDEITSKIIVTDVTGIASNVSNPVYSL
jgi:hypothetical protein